MNLDVDAIFDRRRLKRGIFIWRGLALAAFIVIVTLGAVMLSEDAGFGLGDQAYVARLDVSNIIVEDHNRLLPSYVKVGYRSVVTRLRLIEIVTGGQTSACRCRR